MSYCFYLFVNEMGKVEATMKETLMQQGVHLMVFGMITVYAFLIALVIITILVSKFVARKFPEPMIAAPQPDVELQPLVDARTEKIIKQAIRLHRRVNS
jgi:oxaloacetate decarboxylase (Na+ extruding) subunit gamma